MYELSSISKFPLFSRCYTEDYEFIYFSFDMTVGTFTTSYYIGTIKLLDITEDERKEMLKVIYAELSKAFAFLLHYDALTLIGACRDELAGTGNRIISFTLSQLTDEELSEDELKKWTIQLQLLKNLRLKKLDGEEIHLIMDAELGLVKGEAIKSSTRITFHFTRHLEEFVDTLLKYENSIEWEESNRVLLGFNELIDD